MQKYAAPAQAMVSREHAQQLRELAEVQHRAEVENHKALAIDLQRRLDARDLEVRFAREREFNALKLLKALVEGLQSTDLEVPGYEDAMAFFIQEKMLGRGGAIALDLPVTGSDDPSSMDNFLRNL